MYSDALVLDSDVEICRRGYHCSASIRLRLEPVAGRLGNYMRFGFNLVRETCPLRNMKREQSGAEERRVL